MDLFSKGLIFTLLHSRIPFIKAFQRVGRVRSHVVCSGSYQSISSENEPEVHELEGIERVLCLSDLHTDHKDNFQWLAEEVSKANLQKSDLVVVAGDISHQYTRFEDSLRLIADQAQVLFLPGNHEAWLAKDDPAPDSIEKLELLESICRKMGVFTSNVRVHGEFPLWIVPLWSWYDGSLSFDDELSRGLDKWPWVDFARCQWTDRFPLHPNSSSCAKIPQGLVEFFHRRNEPALNQLTSLVSPSDGVMTVSHFLPNKQSLPDWCDLDATTFDVDNWLTHGAGLVSAKFAKVAGTELLDTQIRSLNIPGTCRQIHVFGHSHRPKDFEFEDIRYIHNPLGKPTERDIEMVNPKVSFQLVWEPARGEVSGPRIIRYFEQFGGGLELTKKKLLSKPPGRYQRGGDS